MTSNGVKKEFQNKVVVITGGGSGIGLGIAKAFAVAGAKVIIMGRQLSKLKIAQKEIGSLGSCTVYVADVSNFVSVSKTIKAINKKFKTIDILVNCAGVYGPIGQHHENNMAVWKQAIDINLLGTVNVVHEVLPLMLKAKHGKIINLSGGGAVQPFPNFSAYATSKAAIVRFTENLATEYINNNIQINAIAPGAINTTFLQQVLKAKTKAGEDFYNKSIQQQQSGGDSLEDAAGLILFLAGTKNLLTGKLISAKWDAWKKMSASDIAKLNKSSEYTLRRIDNKYFYAK